MTIPWNVIAAISPAALAISIAAIAILGVLRGQLVTKAQHDARMKDKDTEIEAWRSAYQVEREKNERLIIPMAELQRDVLRSIPLYPRLAPDPAPPHIEGTH